MSNKGYVRCSFWVSDFMNSHTITAMEGMSCIFVSVLNASLQRISPEFSFTLCEPFIAEVWTWSNIPFALAFRVRSIWRQVGCRCLQRQHTLLFGHRLDLYPLPWHAEYSWTFPIWPNWRRFCKFIDSGLFVGKTDMTLKRICLLSRFLLGIFCQEFSFVRKFLLLRMDVRIVPLAPLLHYYRHSQSSTENIHWHLREPILQDIVWGDESSPGEISLSPIRVVNEAIRSGYSSRYP